MAGPVSFDFMRREGRDFFSWNSTSWFVYLPLFRITVTLVPSEREGLFLGWQKSWSAMGLSAPGAQQAWLPSENGQPVTVRHLLIQSMARCMRWAPTFNQSQWESGSKAPSYIQPSPGCHCILAGRAFLIREGGHISLPVIQPVSVEGCLASKLLVWKKCGRLSISLPEVQRWNFPDHGFGLFYSICHQEHFRIAFCLASCPGKRDRVGRGKPLYKDV